MAERWSIGGEVVEAGVHVAGGKVRVALGERVVEYTAIPLADGSVRLVGPDGARIAVVDGDRVTIAGRTREVRRAPPAAREAPPVVTPPMPAVVGRVLVAVGDVVAAKQPLVTVTAMKMEVVLRAPHAGTVAVVRVAPGDKVNPGDVLVEVVP